MINIFWDASQWCITKLKERPWLGYLNNMPWMEINVIDYEQWRFWISKTFLVMNKSLICYPFLKKCWSLIAIIIIKIDMVEIWIYNSKPLDQGNPCYYYIKYFQFVRLRFGIRHDQMLQVGLKYIVLFLRIDLWIQNYFIYDINSPSRFRDDLIHLTCYQSFKENLETKGREVHECFWHFKEFGWSDHKNYKNRNDQHKNSHKKNQWWTLKLMKLNWWIMSYFKL